MTAEISVIVCTYDQASRLALTLRSFRVQEPPGRPWELVVVDDGSTDDTPRVLAAAGSSLPLRVVRQENAGRSAARNAGAAAATGGILVFCDGDRVAAPGFVRAHAAAVRQAPGEAHVGDVREVYLSDLDGKREQLETDIDAGCRWIAGRSRHPFFFAELLRHLTGPDGTVGHRLSWLCFLSGNLSLSRELFDRAGGFDEDFVGWGMEHFELGYRVTRAGGGIRYFAAAANYHLAHRRPPGAYERGLADSAALIRRKHPAFPVTDVVRWARQETTLAQLLGDPC